MNTIPGVTFRPIHAWPGAMTPPDRRSPGWQFKAGWSSTTELLGRELRALNARPAKPTQQYCSERCEAAAVIASARGPATEPPKEDTPMAEPTPVAAPEQTPEEDRRCANATCSKRFTPGRGGWSLRYCSRDCAIAATAAMQTAAGAAAARRKPAAKSPPPPPLGDAPIVELRTLVSEIVVDGDSLVRITQTPDGRACPWCVSAALPEGLGPSGDRDLRVNFDTEPAAIRAAQQLAGRLDAARKLLREANQKVNEARSGLKDAAKAGEPA